VAHTDRVTKVNAHQFAGPYLLDQRLVSISRQLENLTAAVVAGGTKQEIVFTPHGHADVHARGRLVRMTPQQLAIIWVDADDVAIHQSHQLILAINFDEQWG